MASADILSALIIAFRIIAKKNIILANANIVVC